MANAANLTESRIEVARSATVIGSNVTVEDGRIIVDNDLVIYGLVDANIEAGGKVNVAAGGRVTGRIQAESVSISGVVRGEVDSRNTFRLEDTGELYGRATARRFAVAPGSAGEFQLTMVRDDSIDSLPPVQESREHYLAALQNLSEQTGEQYEPSEGYLKWFEKQIDRGTDNPSTEQDVWSREPAADVSSREPIASPEEELAPDKEEIVIDWPQSPDDAQAQQERIDARTSVGRAAWSKSVGDEVGRKNSGHFVLSPEEIELVAGRDRDPEGESKRPSTDELLDSKELRDGIKELGKGKKKRLFGRK